MTKIGDNNLQEENHFAGKIRSPTTAEVQERERDPIKGDN